MAVRSLAALLEFDAHQIAARVSAVDSAAGAGGPRPAGALKLPLPKVAAAGVHRSKLAL